MQVSAPRRNTTAGGPKAAPSNVNANVVDLRTIGLMSYAALDTWTSPKALGGQAAIALGTMNFGKRIDEREAVRIIARAEEQGIDFLDTANVYADGESERIVGRAVAGRRDRFIIATKTGLNRVEGRPEGLARNRVLSACDASLTRLATDYIDVYYLHAPDPRTPIEDTLAALDKLLSEGKIRAWGVSNYASWQILEMFHLCDQMGLVRPVISQVIYNLLIRQIDHEYTRFAGKYRLHTTVYNPLAGGLLSGKYPPGSQWTRGSRFDDNAIYQRRYWSEKLLTLVESYRKLVPEMDLVKFAYAWTSHRPGVDSILVGPASVEHLDRAIEGCRETLPPELGKGIDEIHFAFVGTDANYAR